MNFILMQFSYPPVIIKTEDKANYFSALQQADSGIIEPFIDYIAKNLVRSLEIMIAGVTGKSIEEPDDLDKEIALLEQRFKAVAKENQVPRTKEAILDIYDNSIVNLWYRFFSASRKFDSFYAKSKQSLWVLGTAWSGINALEVIRPEINENTDFIEMSYNFTSLNHEGLTNYNYQSEIEFNFNYTNSYTVNLSGKPKILEKPYGVQLTDNEINELVRLETRRHKDFIEAKLKEVQDNPSS
jgi:hypothetical protein